MLPMSIEFGNLISFKPGHLSHFLTPERSIWKLIVFISNLSVCIFDYILIEHVFTKVPNCVFFSSTVNTDLLCIWRVSINRFTLNIIELEFFICVFRWNNCRGTNHLTLVRLEFLHSFEFFSLSRNEIIHITMKSWIITKTLMPSQEWVIESEASFEPINDLFQWPRGIRNSEIGVLLHALMETTCFVCCTKTSISSISVNTPHVCNSLLNIIFIDRFGHVSWGNQPEQYILQLQFEHC